MKPWTEVKEHLLRQMRKDNRYSQKLGYYYPCLRNFYHTLWDTHCPEAMIFETQKRPDPVKKEGFLRDEKAGYGPVNAHGLRRHRDRRMARGRRSLQERRGRAPLQALS